MLVIGRMSESRQDLRRWVGIGSKGQVALEEEMIALRTSSSVAGAKLVIIGGMEEGEEWGELKWLLMGFKDEQSLDILSVKKSMKAVESCAAEW